MRKKIGLLGFCYVGKIDFDKNSQRFSFQLEPDYVRRGARAKDCGWVYFWVMVNESDLFDICYVGKAGHTLKARCSQHLGGFHDTSKSKKGEKKAKLIRDYLTAGIGNEIHLFARKSSNETIMGEDDVSMCEAEERAMLMKLRRHHINLWNAP